MGNLILLMISVLLLFSCGGSRDAEYVRRVNLNKSTIDVIAIVMSDLNSSASAEENNENRRVTSIALSRAIEDLRWLCDQDFSGNQTAIETLIVAVQLKHSLRIQ